jgi:hypothetical protein
LGVPAAGSADLIRRTRRTKPLAVQAAELAIAVPQVIAHRSLRMAMAGGSPSARDRKEFHRMGAEKVTALAESWNAMAMETFLANQRLALSYMQSLWFPWLPRPSARRQFNNAALGILGKGMAPFHGRATANAKRLGRVRKRR